LENRQQQNRERNYLPAYRRLDQMKHLVQINYDWAETGSWYKNRSKFASALKKSSIMSNRDESRDSQPFLGSATKLLKDAKANIKGKNQGKKC
jgi:hypothetical protein